ncbi:MAG: T9SS type A sorting domain-containing protein [Flavipsychrobacter sp.]
MMKTFTQVLLLVALCFVATTVEAQYCLLPGRTIYSANQPGITNFKLNSIDRTSSNVEKATLSEPSIVVTGESTTLERGKTYTVSITHSKDPVFFPTARNNIRVWLDYDGNKDFSDMGETIISKDFETAGTFTGTFTVPMTAPLGTTRLRATAKMSSDAGHTIPTPCDLPKDPIDYHGEMEDYDVTIVDPPATAISHIQNTSFTTALYPNPTTGQLTIALNGSKGNSTIELYDVTGKMIATISNQSSASSYTIDLNDYTKAAGVYYVKVLAEGSYTYNKVVKVN